VILEWIQCPEGQNGAQKAKMVPEKEKNYIIYVWKKGAFSLEGGG
jgi:hypothetical protein